MDSSSPSVRGEGGRDPHCLQPWQEPGTCSSETQLRTHGTPQPETPLLPSVLPCDSYAYPQASSCRHKHSALGVTLLSRKVLLCLHTARENQDLNSGLGPLTMNYCIVETYRFAQSPHNLLYLYLPRRIWFSCLKKVPLNFTPCQRAEKGWPVWARRTEHLSFYHTPTHIRRHLSFPPLATLWPSGLQSTAYTYRQCQTGSHRGRGQTVKSRGPGPTAASMQ